MHFLVLAGASLVGAVAAIVLAVRAASALRTGERLRASALLAWSFAVSLYVWGTLHVLGAVLAAEDGGTGSFPLGPCAQVPSRVVGYDVGYLWPGFDCRLSDGGSYPTSVVPAWVNPAAAVLAVTGLVLVLIARRRRARPEIGRAPQRDGQAAGGKVEA